jgi:hypothetical protein
VQTPQALPAIVLSAAALGLGGCGSGGTATRSAPASTAPGAVARAAGARAAVRCARAVRSEPALSPALRRRLEAVCATAASGDQRALARAAENVCEELIERSSLPVGTAREQALKACARP